MDVSRWGECTIDNEQCTMDGDAVIRECVDGLWGMAGEGLITISMI